MNFEQYPFEKLNKLLENITPNEKYKIESLTIGEPQFETPLQIQNELKNSSDLLRKYPKTSGEEYLRKAILGFIKNRFQIDINSNQIIPTFGTREVLFNFPQFYLYDKKDPTIAFTNPFYQIYEGAAIASKAKIIHINISEENKYIPHLTNTQLQNVDIVILNFPNNPTGASISLEILISWVKKALEYNFILLNDECYSEIYTNENEKPPSLLQASIKAQNRDFRNILVLNSISKRSSAPGLRSGFIAGDSKILEKYKIYRTYSGCASPLPLQKASALAWSDQKHVDNFRKIYKQNLILAKEILNIKIPNSTFFIWLKVKDDLEFTKNLYKQKSIKVLPGRFLGRNNMGKNYVRIALVHHNNITKDILLKIKNFMND